MCECGPAVALELCTGSHEPEVHAAEDRVGTAFCCHGNLVLSLGTEDGDKMHPERAVLPSQVSQVLEEGRNGTTK